MNMMSFQERREEQAVPGFVHDLKTDLDDDSAASIAAESPQRATLLDRLGWFRNLTLSGKINAIFGTFLGVGVLMVVVLGAGHWGRL